MRVWANRTPGGTFLNGRREGAQDIGPIVSTCQRRVTPLRLNGVRVAHDLAVAVLGGAVVGPRWLITKRREPIRVRTCRGRRR